MSGVRDPPAQTDSLSLSAESLRNFGDQSITIIIIRKDKIIQKLRGQLLSCE